MPTNFADRRSYTDQEALDFHAGAKPGKLEIRASKPMATQKDLSLAYSPGVAAPVLAIAKILTVSMTWRPRRRRSRGARTCRRQDRGLSHTGMCGVIPVPTSQPRNLPVP